MIFKTTTNNFNLSSFVSLPSIYLIAIRDSQNRQYDKLGDFCKVAIPFEKSNENTICLLAYTTFENALKGTQNLLIHDSKETIYANYMSDQTCRIYKLDKFKEIVAVPPSHSIHTTFLLGCKGIALDVMLDDLNQSPGIFCPLETLLSRGPIE